jgi:hypothetical protein
MWRVKSLTKVEPHNQNLPSGRYGHQSVIVGTEVG